MTTVVANREGMAADTLVTGDGEKLSMTKIHQVGRSLVGIAGEPGPAMALIRWLKDGSPSDAPDPKGVTLLQLTLDGLYLYEDCLMPYKVLDSVVAIGSGSQAARVAVLRYGASLREAIEAAAAVDPHTGSWAQYRRLSSVL